MIPVLGIPVLNRPDLLRECLASIDEPVERLIIIDNSGTGELGDIAAELRPDALVVDPPSNLGVAASWNFIIRTTPEAPWWALVNADVAFAPRALAELAYAMDLYATEPPNEPHLATLIEFGAFGLNDTALDTLGWFDENYHPIYCEDTDYRRRCELAGVPIFDIPNDSTHVGSVSYRGNPLADNARTYPENVAYYRAKWGGWIGQETYTTPFDAGGSVADWRLDRRRLASQSWKGG